MALTEVSHGSRCNPCLGQRQRRVSQHEKSFIHISASRRHDRLSQVRAAAQPQLGVASAPPRLPSAHTQLEPHKPPTTQHIAVTKPSPRSTSQVRAHFTSPLSRCDLSTTTTPYLHISFCEKCHTVLGWIGLSFWNSLAKLFGARVSLSSSAAAIVLGAGRFLARGQSGLPVTTPTCTDEL